MPILNEETLTRLAEHFNAGGFTPEDQALMDALDPDAVAEVMRDVLTRLGISATHDGPRPRKAPLDHQVYVGIAQPEAVSAPWVVYSDGSSVPNPGEMAIGVVIYDNTGEQRGHISERIGQGTSNIAEYEAAIAGVKMALDLGATVIELRLDSELVARQLLGTYAVHSRPLRPLHKSLQELTRRCTFRVVQVPREQNKLADLLAEQAYEVGR
jgi:ribonuclease HI